MRARLIEACGLREEGGHDLGVAGLPLDPLGEAEERLGGGKEGGEGSGALGGEGGHHRC